MDGPNKDESDLSREFMERSLETANLLWLAKITGLEADRIKQEWVRRTADSKPAEVVDAPEEMPPRSQNPDPPVHDK
jgi:hypothetical protein